MRLDSYFQMGFYWIIAYQWGLSIVTFILIIMQYYQRWNSHRMKIYVIIFQVSIIRMWIPLLDFEDRKSYMQPIEMNSFIINQANFLLLSLVVEIQLKFNFYAILANMFISIVFIQIGTIKMFEQHGPEMSTLSLFFSNFNTVIFLSSSYLGILLFCKFSNDVDMYQILRIFYDKYIL